MNVDNISKAVIAIVTAATLAFSIYNSTQIQNVHVSINSRMDQLLAERGKSSMAEGVSKERARQDAVDSQ